MKTERKIDRINSCKEHGLPTVIAQEFFYPQKQEAMKFAENLYKKYGSFNLRTDYPVAQREHLGNLPFFKGINPEQLEKLIEEHKERLTYIVHENINDELLLFNGIVFINRFRELKGEINRIDKTSNRVAMYNFPQHLEQIVISETADYIEHSLVNKALKEIRYALLTKGLFPWILTEVTAHHNNNDIRFIYWELTPSDEKHLW